MSTLGRLVSPHAWMLAGALGCGLSPEGRAQLQWGCYAFTTYGITYDAPVSDGAGRRLEGPNYLAMLHGGPGTNGLQALPPALPFQTAPRAGHVVTTGVNILRYVPGVGQGTVGYLQVRAWNARLGASYEEVAQRALGGYGESEIFRAVSGCEFQAGAGYLDGLKSFSLRPVVSPVVFARVQGQKVFIDWVGDLPRYQLEQKGRMDEPWVPLGDPVTTNSVTVVTTNAAQFIRVVALPQ